MMIYAVAVLLLTVSGSLAQQMSNQSCLTQPCVLGTSFVDVALVIDSSASIDLTYFKAIQKFLVTWASDYSIGNQTNQVQFGFVTYGLWADSVGTFSTASSTFDTLSKVASDLSYQGFNDRNMFDALTKVGNNLVQADSNSGWRLNAKHMMVIFSGDTFSGPSWTAVSTSLNAQFDLVVAVGLTMNSIKNQYQQLVDIVGGDPANVFLIGGATELNYIIPWLEYKTCDVSSSVSTSPRPPTTMGPSTTMGTAPSMASTPSMGPTAPPSGGSTPSMGPTMSASGGTTPSMGPTASPSGGMSTTPFQANTCQDYYNSGQTQSGVYPISINGTNINVYCDMDGGGWTVIQSRIDGSVDFNVSYEAYRWTLGVASDPYSDFWLGNELIHTLTQMYQLILRVKLYDCDHDGFTFAKYMSFHIDGNDKQFALHTDSITDDSDAGDAFNNPRFGFTDQGRAFSTAATYSPQGGDTGGPPAAQCTALIYGGWWFGACNNNLNGKWYDVKPPSCLDTFPDGIRWARGGNYSLPRTVMEVMPLSGVRLP